MLLTSFSLLVGLLLQNVGDTSKRYDGCIGCNNCCLIDSVVEVRALLRVEKACDALGPNDYVCANARPKDVIRAISRAD